MKRIVTISILFLILTNVTAQSNRQIFDFEFEEVLLNGVLNLPKDQKPKGIVILVHGSGETNAVAQEWYLDIRETFVRAGYGIYMWDKMGCGKSGGTFDYNQSVHNSALEVIAAIRTLREKQIPGSDTIGLYGGSRAGWINPIVIDQFKDIAFWVSVSGVDDKENFGYLLKQNLRIDGLPKDSINLIVSEWKAAIKIHHSGGSYESALNATPNLRKNDFILRFNNGSTITEDEYYSYQKTLMKEELDAETGLPIIIRDFETILSKVRIPVLALFGETDMNVDWKKTKLLYEKTLAKNTELEIKSFPNCNHNIQECETGGFYEFQDNNLPFKRCDGFLETLEGWLDRR
ncbi:alpha/beta hydrolase family protein [Aquimarina litoralis]|uniref:alpha/beta hydrolase family protein n=1 Tax=Aquimarina litoralis TaxID=584605 RepID=UPI001C591AFB|nr:alpha/beta hydrolase [Aquimarina litoralis]MBW1295649.1 alpha/beta hydrolase [Aquimarina litoralis]